LEVTEEVTIKIPRRQIDSITYDNIDPILEREKRVAAAKAAADATTALFPAQKVSPAIGTRLSADISNPQITFDKRDLVEAIAELNKLQQVSGLIDVDKPVSSMPAEERLWTYSTTPGTTLAVALDALIKAFPKLATVIRDDKLLITDQETAQKIVTALQPAPPPSTAPAPTGTAPPAAPAAPAQ